jgi:hypothetical protein
MVGMSRISENGTQHEGSIYAAEGTAAHKLAEMCLRDNIKKLYPSLITQNKIPKEIKVEVNEGEEMIFEVTGEMMDAVNVYLEAVNEVRTTKSTLLVEAQVNISDNICGTADAVVAHTSKATVFDFKYGKGVQVEAPGNSQLLLYALGVIKSRIKVQNIKVVIVQPRLSTGANISYAEYKRGEVIAFGKDVERMEKRILDEHDMSLSIGDHCRWCKARVECPAQDRLRKEIIKVEELKNLPSPSALTLEEMSKVVVQGAMLTDWVKAVTEHAHRLAETGQKIPGLKLVEKRAIRRWKNETEARRFLVQFLGSNGAFEQKLLSPAKAEKVLKGKDIPLPPLLISKEASGTKIVPENAKGKEVQAKSVKRMFLEEAEELN